jgi:hypothetical protein
MNNNVRAFSAVLSLIVLAVTAASAQAQRPSAPGTQPPAPTLNPGVQPPLCDVILRIRSTDPEERGHLKVTQWLRFIGPISPQGHMVVLPVEKNGVPKHAWRPGLRVAIRTGDPEDPLPWMFILRVPVLSLPDHPGIEIHQYIMTVKALDDGCPSNVDFDTLPHDDEIIDDHPGHANAD